MSKYPNLNHDPELFKLKTKDDDIEDIGYKIEKDNHEKVLK